VEYFVSWHIMKWLFRRLFPASGSPVCFLQSETVIQTKRRHFIVFAWRNSNELSKPLWQPWPGVSPTAIFNGEKALGTRLRTSFSSAQAMYRERSCTVWRSRTALSYYIILPSKRWCMIKLRYIWCQRNNRFCRNCSVFLNLLWKYTKKVLKRFLKWLRLIS